MQIWTPSWQPLRPFALELIVEKSLASAGLPLSPGDGLRRVFESISGGCILQVHIVNIFNFTKKNYVKPGPASLFLSVFLISQKNEPEFLISRKKIDPEFLISLLYFSFTKKIEFMIFFSGFSRSFGSL